MEATSSTQIMMDSTSMLEKLKDVPPGSFLFVSYVAGRTARPHALREANRAIRTGINPRHFTGVLTSVWTTKSGAPVVTLWVNERDTEKDGTVTQGAYRTFNPALGTLMTLEVIDVAAPLVTQ